MVKHSFSYGLAWLLWCCWTFRLSHSPSTKLIRTCHLFLHLTFGQLHNTTSGSITWNIRIAENYEKWYTGTLLRWYTGTLLWWYRYPSDEPHVTSSKVSKILFKTCLGVSSRPVDFRRIWNLGASLPRASLPRAPSLLIFKGFEICWEKFSPTLSGLNTIHALMFGACYNLLYIFIYFLFSRQFERFSQKQERSLDNYVTDNNCLRTDLVQYRFRIEEFHYCFGN